MIEKMAIKIGKQRSMEKGAAYDAMVKAQRAFERATFAYEQASKADDRATKIFTKYLAGDLEDEDELLNM